MIIKVFKQTLFTLIMKSLIKHKYSYLAAAIVYYRVFPLPTPKFLVISTAIFIKVFIKKLFKQ